MAARAPSAVVACFACLLAVGRAQQQPAPPEPPTYDELQQLIASSSLKYEIVEDTTVPAIAVAAARVLPPGLTVGDDGKSRIVTMPKPPSAETRKAFDRCEEIFARNDFKAAAACFEELRKQNPTLTIALTNMGDSFYQAKDFERAKEYLTKAAEENPADYQIRWFLGDALWRAGEPEGGIEQLAFAHLLNVNHADLKAHFIDARRAIGRPWNGWELRPRFTHDKKGDTVTVRHAPGWKGYAVVKAVWKYEPGFAERFGGADYAKLVVCIPEERRALEALVTDVAAPGPIADAVKDGFCTEMIVYEMLLPRVPIVMHTLANPLQQRLVAYLQRYH